MPIHFSNTLLASPNVATGRVGPAGMAWNGAPIFDVAQFFRDLYATVFGRADGPEEFSFSSQWLFSSDAEVLLFCCTHRSTLALQADLTITDHAGTVALVMRNAVRQVNIGEVRGVSVRVDYKFTGRKFELLEDVPEFDDEDDRMKIGVEDIDADAEEIGVVFDTPFGDVPRSVNAIVEAPGSNPAVAVVGLRDVSAAGFTAVFAAALPASGYKLRWQAWL